MTIRPAISRAGVGGLLKSMGAFRIMNAFRASTDEQLWSSGARGKLTISTHARNPLGGEYGQRVAPPRTPVADKCRSGEI
jgi:hypothetical protein